MLRIPTEYEIKSVTVHMVREGEEIDWKYLPEHLETAPPSDWMNTLNNLEAKYRKVCDETYDMRVRNQKLIDANRALTKQLENIHE